MNNTPPDISRLKRLVEERDPSFWRELASATAVADGCDGLLRLSTLRRRAVARGLPAPAQAGRPLRLAITGGYSFYPLKELIEHLLAVENIQAEIFVGLYDGYVAEANDPASELYGFKPDLVWLWPNERDCRFTGSLRSVPDAMIASAANYTKSLYDVATRIHERSGAGIIISNFMLPARRDMGSFRIRIPASEWNFRRAVNLEMGLRAPSFVEICDIEFLGNRLGALRAEDRRAWFETKQPGSPIFLTEIAWELVHIIRHRKAAPKKVLVLDLDNTLWGGVLADDGLDGIELGSNSSRGEAFRAFQGYVADLRKRGVLLAVCSKNDHDKVMEVFQRHPEMLLKLEDFVAFKANWEPKSENLRRIATELRLGEDSLVFVDDNPAEIEIVRQFAPDVATVLLGPDPADYVAELQDRRLFDRGIVSAEDEARTEQYRAELNRESVRASVTDMDSYLVSLEMVATIRRINPIDVPRVAQLINKSNQFNLTTRRRSEAELLSLLENANYSGFSIRLCDKFGDSGLIAVVIAEQEGAALRIDTWLMSCRVLQRRMENITLNEIARIAFERGCSRIEGVYLATAKNKMVRGLYESLGFSPVAVTEERGEYVLDLDGFNPHAAPINIKRDNP